MATLPVEFARAQLAEAARNAEVEALALLNMPLDVPMPSARDALVALAICTAHRVRAAEPRKVLERGVALRLDMTAWTRLVEFLATDLAYQPSEAFPYTKWDLAAAWLLPQEEESLFELKEEAQTV